MRCEQRRTVILFLALPLTLLLLFTVFPFFHVIYSSFFSMSYTKNQGFVGLGNYAELLTVDQYRRAVAVSVYYMCAAVVQVVAALLLSFLLMKCRFAGLYRTLLTLPYMISGIAVGCLFKLFYTRGYVLDTVLGILGLPLEMLPYWLRDQSINNWALAFASVWRYTGLSLVVFSGAIGAVNRTLFEASSLDGANQWQQYRYIVWPHIRKTVGLNLLLSITSSLSEFELPYAIASGGANGTATCMILIYRIAFIEHRVGLASAMVVLLLSQILLFALLLLHLSRITDRADHLDGWEEK